MASWAARPMLRRTDTGSAQRRRSRRRAPIRSSGFGQRGEDADRGGLAGAVRAEHRADGAARHVEVDAVERGLLAVALDETDGFNGG